MPTIKNKKELERLLNKYIKSSLEKTQKVVYDTIDKSIKEFYNEYSPMMYRRTYSFLESLMYTNVVKNRDSYICEVKIDDGYLNYKYPGNESPANTPATGYDVAKWADRQNLGFHGGNHGYTVDAGRDDGFWNIAIEELEDVPGLIRLFKKNLIKSGLQIK